MKRKRAAWVAAIAIGVSACAPPNPRWNEEVQFSDGSVVVVERETIDEPGGDEWAFNRAGVKPKEHRIRLNWLKSAMPCSPAMDRRSTGCWPRRRASPIAS